MLPIIDKPIIHYLVEEAVKSGITDIIIVTRAGQMTLEDYFDSHAELEGALERAGKTERLKIIKDIPKMANFVYVRQNADLPYGNATPLLCVKPLIDNDESFVYMFGDDLTLSEVPVTKQLIDIYEKENPSAVFAVQEVADSEVGKYGTVKYKEGSNEIEGIEEKLPFGEAPSNMAAFGRYVFSYDVVERATKTEVGKGNELWVTDILNNLAHEGKKVIAQPIKGRWLTTGDPLNYLKASVEFALERDDIGKPFREYLKNIK
jgi:UTP--glucose-1-phosphate uridylyltransferase